MIRTIQKVLLTGAIIATSPTYSESDNVDYVINEMSSIQNNLETLRSEISGCLDEIGMYYNGYQMLINLAHRRENATQAIQAYSEVVNTTKTCNVGDLDETAKTQKEQYNQIVTALLDALTEHEQEDHDHKPNEQTGDMNEETMDPHWQTQEQEHAHEKGEEYEQIIEYCNRKIHNQKNAERYMRKQTKYAKRRVCVKDLMLRGGIPEYKDDIEDPN